MNRFAVGGLFGLLLFISGCGGKEKFLIWNFEPVDRTSFTGICVEATTARKVDKKLCKDLPLPAEIAKGFESQYIHCKPLPDYVWTDCNPQYIEMLSEGREEPKSREVGNIESKAFYCGFIKIGGRVLPGCPDDRVLAWSIVQKDQTTFVGVCAEVLPDFTERIVDKKLCRNKEFPIERAKMLGNRFFNCKPEDHYVWTNCNPDPLQSIREEGERQKKLGY